MQAATGPMPPFDEHRKRLRWRCRRGMRELDVVLEAFLDRAYDSAAPALQADFGRLIEHSDPELYAWFTERAAPGDPALRALIARLLDNYRSGLALR